MWSVGIITTMLLTGDVIWRPGFLPIPEQDQKKEMAMLAKECDLRVIDSPFTIWQEVEKRPKDFVKRLLVVDETKRLDVKQALEHPWFTNKMCREGFIAVYHKAIESWQPRRKTFRVIEALDLSRLRPVPPSNRDNNRSRYFNDYAVPYPQGELFASPARVPSTAMRGPLATIGEEATPEPETPTGSPLMPPLSPRSRKPLLPSSPNMQGVGDSLGQLELDAPSETGPDMMCDHDQQMQDDSFDLDAPVRQAPPPWTLKRAPEHEEAVPETPPMTNKRMHNVLELEETYDSSLEVLSERFMTGPKFAKKARLLR